ncbi:MAG: NAD-dependent DNA ligase LigA [Simkaniaceae bacterium]|nr:NAD-dependent DNA ligase LigA [Simkaniaceae bacterium]
MNKSDYKRLLEEIREHDFHYYIEAKPIISDFEYDQLYKKLEQIEAEHPDWVVSSSPTQSIRDSIHRGFKQVEHNSPMLSLANTYSREEVEEFVARVHRLLDYDTCSFCCELKMDGLAISLTYEDGHLLRAVTRGNGRKGDDVTANIRTIKSLPLNLKGDVPHRLDVRAEVYMPLEVFQMLNQEKEEAGEEVYANPRNAAAGSLKLLDAREVFARRLDLFVFSIETPGVVKSQMQAHERLKEMGFPTFSESHFAQVKSADEIMKFAGKVEDQRHKLPFEIDGIVVKLDEVDERGALGSTAKSPRWAMAYKFAPEQGQTIVKEITVQVGRTGVLTPVAELEPTYVSGSKISRATLHNAEEVRRLDVRIGDTVTIEKGGDVIPKVVEVILDKRPSNAQEWQMPTSCPSCGSAVIHVPGEVAIRCSNVEGCGNITVQRIIFFASKKAMNIENLGDKIVERFYHEGLVKSLSDIYRLKPEDIEGMEGFKQKSIDNLMQSIEKSKEISLHRFIFALGIKYVGEGTAEILAAEFGSLERIGEQTEESLEAIEGIGPKVASSIVAFFNEEKNLSEIEQLLGLGVQPKLPKKKQLDHDFLGKTFVLTGSLESFTRSEAADKIKERGGKVSGSVSKKTDYVLVGEDPGSKFDKAKKLGIEILSEKDFENLL